MFYTFFQSKTIFLFYALLSKTGLGGGSVMSLPPGAVTELRKIGVGRASERSGQSLSVICRKEKDHNKVNRQTFPAHLAEAQRLRLSP